MTRSIQACLEPVQNTSRRAIASIGLPKSPPGIETDAHVLAVIPNIVEAVTENEAEAYVIACFSDPGIPQVRRATTRPVVGIAEAAYLAALGLGARFGIVSMGPSSIGRHLRQLRALGFDGRMAGDRAIGMTVPQLMASDVVETVVRTGRLLIDDGAEVLILGCAGLGGYREALQARLGLPVVDPVQAGAALALTLLDLGYAARVRP